MMRILQRCKRPTLLVMALAIVLLSPLAACAQWRSWYDRYFDGRFGYDRRGSVYQRYYRRSPYTTPRYFFRRYYGRDPHYRFRERYDPRWHDRRGRFDDWRYNDWRYNDWRYRNRRFDNRRFDNRRFDNQRQDSNRSRRGRPDLRHPPRYSSDYEFGERDTPRFSYGDHFEERRGPRRSSERRANQGRN